MSDFDLRTNNLIPCGYIQEELNYCPVDITISFMDLHRKQQVELQDELIRENIDLRNALNARFLRIWCRENDN